MPEAVEWFEENYEKVFDWLGIPSETEHGRFFRTEAYPRILSNLKGKRYEKTFMSGSRFAAEMEDVLRAAGYQRPPGVDRNSVEFHKSHAFLIQAWNFSMAISQGYVGWKSKQNVDVMKAFPGWELLRFSENEPQHDWPSIWKSHGGNFYEDGRMIAMVNDPIWGSLSRFGLPWPPFEIDDPMGVRTVRWREALRLGLVDDDRGIGAG